MSGRRRQDEGIVLRQSEARLQLAVDRRDLGGGCERYIEVRNPGERRDVSVDHG